MMHRIDTGIGTLQSANTWLDSAIVKEVITDDCYNLRKLATAYTPKIVFDIGSGAGTVSMLVHNLWPDAKITCFEMEPHLVQLARENVPSALVVCGEVGYGLKAKELIERYGHADLVVCDCEGGEVPFFYDVKGHLKCLERFPVITGEYHFKGARRLLESCFEDGYHRKFIDPKEGAGYWQNFYAVSQNLPINIARAWGI